MNILSNILHFIRCKSYTYYSPNNTNNSMNAYQNNNYLNDLMYNTDTSNNSWDYNKDFDYFSNNDNYPLYEVDRDDSCYNNYNDSSYDYSSSTYWD